MEGGLRLRHSYTIVIIQQVKQGLPPTLNTYTMLVVSSSRRRFPACTLSSSNLHIHFKEDELTALSARPDRGVAADRIIPAFIAKAAQVLVDLDQCQAFPAPTSRVDRQQPPQFLKLGAQLRAWLNRPAVGELRYPGADHLAHRSAWPRTGGGSRLTLRRLQVAADRLDPLALGKMQPPDFCVRQWARTNGASLAHSHDQHPALGLR